MKCVSSGIISGLKGKLTWSFPCRVFEGRMVQRRLGKEGLLEERYENSEVNLLTSGHIPACFYQSRREGCSFSNIGKEACSLNSCEADPALSNVSGGPLSWDGGARSLALKKMCKWDNKPGWQNHFKTIWDPFLFSSCHTHLWDSHTDCSEKGVPIGLAIVEKGEHTLLPDVLSGVRHRG